MANRYWVGGTSTWDSTAGSKWSTTSGGGGGSAVPTAADDVFFSSSSTGTCTTVAGQATCRSIDCTGFTATLALASSSTALSVGDGSGGALKFVSGMTLTNGASSVITFASTSSNGGTGWSLTTGGKNMPATVFNGAGGKWVMQDAWAVSGATRDITLTAGTLDTNGKTLTLGALDASGSTTRTLTMGASAVTCSSTSTAWTFGTSPTNLTFNANTSSVTLSGSGPTFLPGGKTFNTVSVTGATTCVISGALSCASFTRTGTATKTNALQLGGNLTCTGTFTANGNSVTNRLLVKSDVPGTARTISAATVTVTNIDLWDITGAGAGSWNLASVTGNSGNCGGNTSITFTTPAAQTYSGTSSQNWSANAWTSRVPLPQDNVTIGYGTSTFTVTTDMPRMGANITITAGASGTHTLSVSDTASFGNISLPSNALTISGAGDWSFCGSGAQTITNSGRSFGNTGSLRVAGAGTYTLQDALSATGPALSIDAGTFNDGGFNVAVTNVATLAGGTGSLTMSGAWTLTNTSGTVWSASNLTALNATDASSITISTTSASTRSVAQGTSFTYGTFTYTVAGSTGQLTLTGSAPSYYGFNFSDASNVRTLSAGSLTMTIREGDFNVQGTAGKQMTLTWTGTLSRIGGAISIDYCVITSHTASGGAVFYGGVNSTSVSNTGWIFTAPAGGVISAAGGNWSSTASWAGAAVPTAATPIYALAGTRSGNLTLDTTGNCRSFDLYGYNRTFAMGSQTLNVGDGSGGNVRYSTLNTFTFTSGVLTLKSTSSSYTITSAGQTLPALTVNGSGGTWTPADPLNIGSATLTVTAGTLNGGGYNITCGPINGSGGTFSSGVGTLTCGTVTGTGATLTLGAGTVTLTGSISNSTGSLTVSAASVAVTSVTNSGTLSWSGASGTVSGAVTSFAGTTTLTNVAVTGDSTFSGAGASVTTSGSFGGNLTSSANTVNCSSTIAGNLTTTGGTSASFSGTITGTVAANGGTIDTGAVLSSVTIAGASASFGAVTGTITHTSGTFRGATSCTSFASTGSTARAINGGVECTASGTAFDASSTTGLTITAGSTASPYTILLSGADATFASGSLTYTGYAVSMSGAGVATITGAPTVYSLTRNGTATKTNELVLGGDVTCPHLLSSMSLQGNSTINRLLVRSDVLGTTRTLTLTLGVTLNVANFDAQDLTLASPIASTDFSSGSTANCGGNSGITFTTPVTRYGVVAGNWSDTATWSSSSGGAGGASVPLAHDSIVLNASSAAGTYTINMPRVAGIDCTGFTRTLTTSAAFRIFGSLKLVSGMTWSGTDNITLAGRSSYTVTSGTKTFTGTTTVSAPSGTYTLADAFTSGALTITNGTFADGGFAVSIPTFTSNSGFTRGLTVSGAWSLTATAAGAFWTSTSSNNTVTATGHTITLTQTSTNNRTFAGGGSTYGTLAYTVAGSTGGLTVTGANTFATLSFSDANNVRTLTLPASTTTTISTAFSMNGTSSFRMFLVSSSGGTAATLSKSSGTIACDYISIQDSTATGGATWNATNALNVSGNTGWNFGATNITASITDVLGLLDSYTGSLTRPLTDVNGLLDSDTWISAFVRTLGPDTQGLLDAAATALTMPRSFTDSEGLLDSQIRDMSRPVTDVLGSLDSITQIAAYAQSLLDSSGGLDNANNRTLSRLLDAELFGLGDSVSNLTTALATLIDGLGLTDSTAVAGAFIKTVTDVLGLLDAASGQIAIPVSISDSLGSLDSISWLVNFAKTVSDTLGLVEVLAQVAQMSRTSSDLLGGQDSVLLISHYLRSVTSDFDIIDPMSARYDAYVEMTDGIGSIDTASAVRVLIETLHDNLGATDTMSSLILLLRTINDSLGGLDPLTSGFVLTRTTNDLLGLVDDATAIRFLLLFAAIRMKISVAERKMSILAKERSMSLTASEGEEVGGPLP